MFPKRDAQGRRVSWARLAWLLVALPVAVWAACWVVMFVAAFFMSATPVNSIMSLVKDLPRLTPIADPSLLPVKSSVEVNSFGWTLAIPNTTVKSHYDWKVGSDYHFTDGSSLLILDHHDEISSQRAILNFALTESALRPEEARDEYSLERTALLEDFRTPVHFWQSRRTLLRKSSLAMTVLTDSTLTVAVHDVSTGTARGFEFVSQMGSKPLFRVELYDVSGGKIEWMDTPSAPNAQAQLNTILASVKPPM
jgi:hypothetical protein